MSGLFLGDNRLDPVDLDAYCARIGHDGPRTADLSTLQSLHRLHPAAIPFENLDVVTGVAVDLSPAAVDAKLIGRRRGGYCFEQNILFLRVLRTLGFPASPLIARSRWRRPPGEVVARTHMAIRVALDDGDWLADVGFGACMVSSPIRMDIRDPQETAHEPARVTPVDGELRLERQLDGTWMPLYDVVPAAQETVDLVAANWLISTHPASSFRHHLVASRTRDEIRHVLVDARLTVRRATGAPQHYDLDAAGIEACLRDHIGLPVDDAWRPLFHRLAGRPTNVVDRAVTTSSA